MYLPIFSTSLAHIYGNLELILPVKYLSNRIQDIQNIYPNHILLSKQKWIKECEISASKEMRNSEVCDISIELNEIDEKNLIKLDEVFYLYDKPILLSKVKNIWFFDKEQMKVTVGNIEITQGFIPGNLLKIDVNPTFTEFHKPKKRVTKPKDISKNINFYNKYLGGIILAKNLLNKSDIFRFVDEVLLQTDKQLKKDIFNIEIEDKNIERIAKKESIQIKYFAGIINRNRIPKNSLTYIYAMLYTYRPFMNDNLLGLIEEIQENISKEELEKITILYGIMAGYNHLNFKINYQNRKIFNRFQLEKDDLQVLDSVYKTVFKEKILRKDRIVEIAKLDLENINIAELSEKYSVSESTIRKDIREIFGIIKNMRIEKFINLAKLKKLLENSKMTTKEVSEKFEISQGTARKYLKELETKQNRDGRI